MKYGELTLGQTEAIVNKLGGMAGVRRLLADELVVSEREKSKDVFPVSVNYDLSIEALVKAGEYNWVNENIVEKNFPVEGGGTEQVEFHLVHFNRVMNSADVEKELEKLGLRPANLKELLSFGSTYQEEQRKYPIVALGSVWQNLNGNRNVII